MTGTIALFISGVEVSVRHYTNKAHRLQIIQHWKLLGHMDAYYIIIPKETTP